MNPYKHIREEKALPVNAVLVSAMNTFQLPSKKNSVGASYEEIAFKWLNHLPIKVLSKSHFTGGTDEHELQIPVGDIRDLFTYTYTQDGKRKKWFDWFHDNYPLWMSTKRGYVGRYSIATPTFNLIDQLTKIPAETFVEAWAQEYEADKTDDMHIDYISIDTVNLGHYIEYCKGLNNESKKFQRATGRAIMIHKLALGLNETNTCPLTGKVTHFIPQTYTVALSGRRYYTGSSALQSCSKAIRGAALGPCYEVDLSSSVYSYYKQMGSELGVDTHILTDLLSNKAGFRKELADCLTDTKASDEFKLKLVKEVTQAIGFGSDPDSGYSSVSKVIYNAEDYERLTTHPKFIALRKIYKDILACVKVNPDYKAMQKWYKKQTNNGKWTSFMAYLYQSYETIVMTELQQRLIDKDILLWVHDGLYMKRKPIMMDIQYILDGLNKYATVDLEVHEKYSASSGTKSRVLNEESAHRARMAQAEQLAKEKYSSNNNSYSDDPELALAQVLKEQGLTL
tara:strand:- start:926 stop:2455 length:1530 start_codon:yes stop_codon:yes gene_type:complete